MRSKKIACPECGKRPNSKGEPCHKWGCTLRQPTLSNDRRIAPNVQRPEFNDTRKKRAKGCRSNKVEKICLLTNTPPTNVKKVDPRRSIRPRCDECNKLVRPDGVEVHFRDCSKSRIRNKTKQEQQPMAEKLDKDWMITGGLKQAELDRQRKFYVKGCYMRVNNFNW